VIDKENGGGKADAINAGINSARHPIIYAGDADSVLDPHSLEHVVRPFLEDPRTVACGGTVRIVNGCTVRGGVLKRSAFRANPLALVQVVEYLRAFLGGRLGWSAVNGLLIVSGAFGVFHRDTVVEAGGFRADVIGEDMELIVRLHRTLSARGARYRVTFVPDPVCWDRRARGSRHARSSSASAGSAGSRRACGKIANCVSRAAAALRAGSHSRTSSYLNC
jgi:cellulose synthase/poly-beta-1,6-N-acetylglucosamine synthase-like glycosyltransferase